MDPFTMALLGSTAASAISGGLGFLGSQNQAQASKDASKQQMMMQMLALQQQQQQYQQNRADLAPYRGFGETAGNQLLQNLPLYAAGFAPTQDVLEATPGYQWNLSQGLKSVQNSAAARGLGISGAAQRGASNFATGLAKNTLDQQANIFWTNQNNAFNKYFPLTQLGANAAGATANLGQSNTNQQSNLLTGIGNVGAAGITGAAAAQNQGLGSIGQAAASMPMMYYMMRGGSGGFGGAGQAAPSGMYGAQDYYSAAGQAPWGSYGPGF